MAHDADIEQELHAALEERWREGWEPADVLRVVARDGAAAAELAAGIVLADGRRRAARGQRLHPRWAAQLAALAERHPAATSVVATPARLRTARTLLATLQLLPPLPPTMPRPGAAGAASPLRGLDQRMLGRVRALLAKAESTEFEQEAEALTAKAQELIAKHAIDEALLSSAEAVGEPAVRRIPVEDPYADAKSRLLSEVAAANGCRVVYSPGFGWVTAFGYDSALDALELLAASLLAQATGAMARHGSVRDAAGRSRTRSFRRSFLFGFAVRIGHRLAATTQEHVAAAEAEHGQLLPVLAEREARIDEAVALAFPQVVRRRWDVSHAGGWAAGQVAADLADLDVTRGAVRSREGRLPG